MGKNKKDTNDTNETFDFNRSVREFNSLYKIEVNDSPTLLASERIRNFQKIIREEVDEGLDLASKYTAAEEAAKKDGRDISEDERLDVLTDLSDWLGDLIVYAASEARRWGIPIDDVLATIMASNASKLGADGKPIYDERGKVMKGPGYWKPEPKIRELLKKKIKKTKAGGI